MKKTNYFYLSAAIALVSCYAQYSKYMYRLNDGALVQDNGMAAGLGIIFVPLLSFAVQFILLSTIYGFSVSNKKESIVKFQWLLFQDNKILVNLALLLGLILVSS